MDIDNDKITMIYNQSGRSNAMTMLENTISMIKVMPEADLAEIQNFARKLLQRRDVGCPFPLNSREDIYKDLEVSRRQIQNGEYQEAGEFIA